MVLDYQTIKYHSGVTLWDGICNPSGVVVRFSVSITTTKLWDSNYSEYQQYLYDRICTNQKSGSCSSRYLR
ncbi:MAG: hypothetical protein ACJ0QP_06470 [Schleiferiaceae bacterium]